MCTETIYTFTDKTCVCKWSSIVTCPKAKLPPPEKRKCEFPTCEVWTKKFEVLQGRCKEGGCEREMKVNVQVK